jgi:glycosyltransferase involved in cell wall biosynthesis
LESSLKTNFNIDANGIIFIRNSDIRYDNRMRKALSESIDFGLKPIVLGWVRDNGDKPNKNQKVNGKPFSAEYFMLKSRFEGGLRNIFRLIAFNLWILKTIIAHKKSYKLIYVCDLDVSFPAIFAKLFFKKKIVYDIFDFYAHTHSMPRILKKVVEKTEYGICKLSDEVIVCTEKRKAMLKNMTGISPHIIYNTPNIKEVLFKPNFANSAERNIFSIVYVGTLSTDGRLLLEITEQIKNVSGIEFHIAGIGPLDNYFKKTADSFDNIFFYGQITNDEALDMQAKADILFATYDPSQEINRNSAPNKVYEAMALGKPIIVCKDTDADLVVTKNESGYAINYDVNEFMKIVDIYKNNNAIKEEHAMNALQLYQDHYSWSLCQVRLHNIFNDIYHK